MIEFNFKSFIIISVASSDAVDVIVVVVAVFVFVCCFSTQTEKRNGTET